MLDLRENKISSLPSTIGRLSSLTVFLISHNHLKELPPGAPDCQGDYFPEIGECADLVHLDVQHNELTALPDSIGKLSKLSRMGMRYNKLEELPASLAQCTKFEEFIVESNQLTQLPVSLIQLSLTIRMASWRRWAMCRRSIYLGTRSPHSPPAARRSS